MESKLPLRLPIVVGVTGHRDAVLAPSDPALRAPRAAIEAALRGLLSTYPNTPVLVLSGLAEGVDTLAAEVTLALGEEPGNRGSDGRSRISLVAAMPMPLDACAVDFVDPGHAAVVAGFCARAAETVEVWKPGEIRLEGLDPAARRSLLDRSYARLGAYVSRNCHLLLAVWNGRPKREGTFGGTADVVEWFEHGAPTGLLGLAAPHNPLRVPDGLAVLRIPCERASEPGFVADAHAVPSALDRRAAADAVLGQIDEFNEDVETLGSDGAATSHVDRSFEGCGPASDRRAGPGRGCAAAYLDAWGVADVLAQRFQRQRRATILALFGLAALALMLFEFYAHGPEPVRDSPWLLAGYVLGVVGSVLVVILARRRRVEAKYLVYRSFAEALRVQSTWCGLGIRDRADDHYSPLHVDAIAWVRHGLKSLHVRAERSPAPAATPGDALAWVEHAWIAEQIEFFEARIHRAERRFRFLARWSGWLLVVGLLLAPIAVFASHHGAGEADAAAAGHRSETLHGLLLIAMIAAMAASGFCRAWIGQMAYEATIDRYESALRVFRRAQETIRAALARGDFAAGRDAVRALGVEALTENVGWVLLHRDHPLEIRAGG